MILHFVFFILVFAYVPLNKPDVKSWLFPVLEAHLAAGLIEGYNGCGSLDPDFQCLWASEMVPMCEQLTGYSFPVHVGLTVDSQMTAGLWKQTVSPCGPHQEIPDDYRSLSAENSSLWASEMVPGHKGVIGGRLLETVVLIVGSQMTAGHWA